MTPHPAPLSAERLEEIRQRESKATRGPWHFVPENAGLMMDHGFGLLYGEADSWGWEKNLYISVGCSGNVRSDLGEGAGEANAAFIAHARTDIPALLSHVSHLEAQLAKLTAGASLEGVVKAHDEACQAAFNRGLAATKHTDKPEDDVTNWVTALSRDCDAQTAFLQTLRAAFAAKDAEIERLREGFAVLDENLRELEASPVAGKAERRTYRALRNIIARSAGKPDDGR